MFSMQLFQKISKEFLQSYFYLVGNFLVICRASSTLRNFLTFLALDFPADRCPGKEFEISY